MPGLASSVISKHHLYFSQRNLYLFQFHPLLILLFVSTLLNQKQLICQEHSQYLTLLSSIESKKASSSKLEHKNVSKRIDDWLFDYLHIVSRTVKRRK